MAGVTNDEPLVILVAAIEAEPGRIRLLAAFRARHATLVARRAAPDLTGIAYPGLDGLHGLDRNRVPNAIAEIVDVLQRVARFQTEISHEHLVTGTVAKGRDVAEACLPPVPTRLHEELAEMVH